MWSLSSIFKLSTAKMGFFPGNHIILIQKNTGLCKCPEIMDELNVMANNGNLTGIDLSGCKIENGTLPSGLFYSNAVNSAPERRIKIDGDGKTAGRGIVLLEYITLPPNLKKIERLAFGYCDQLKEIDLPAETTEIEDEAFLWCNNIRSFVVHTSNPNIALGSNAVYCKLGNTTLYVPKGAKAAFEQHDAWKGFGAPVKPCV